MKSLSSLAYSTGLVVGCCLSIGAKYHLKTWDSFSFTDDFLAILDIASEVGEIEADYLHPYFFLKREYNQLILFKGLESFQSSESKKLEKEIENSIKKYSDLWIHLIQSNDRIGKVELPTSIFEDEEMLKRINFEKNNIYEEEVASELVNNIESDVSFIPLFALAFSKWDSEDKIALIQSFTIALLGLIILFIFTIDFIVFPIAITTIIAFLFITILRSSIRKAKTYKEKYPHIY